MTNPLFAAALERTIMTEAERIAWGTSEHYSRLSDIAAVKAGEMDMRVAQRRARTRCRQSGMSEREAFQALVDAQRTMRGAS